MSLSTSYREGSENLLLCLHGLGCVKENFSFLWTAPELPEVSLLAVDLPGHGASRGSGIGECSMHGMAQSVAGMLKEHSLDRHSVHLVGHSMGGAVGLLLTQISDLQIASFTNIEGNLVASDCGLLSRRTAEMDVENFVDGKFEKLKASARRSDDPVVRDWAEWMDTCDARALHTCARSVVEWSDGGRLLDMFLDLAVPATYVYGDRSANPDVLGRLGEMPKHEVPDCGHFVMIDKPAELAAIIGSVLSDDREWPTS